MPIDLLQQVRVIDPVSGTDRCADVLLTDGMVSAIEDTISHYPSETIVQDCRGFILGTGLVDLYSHSGEPGFEERETLSSLLQAASAGGFTRLAILPDTKPAIDNPGSVAWVQGEVRSEGRGVRGEGRGVRGEGRGAGEAGAAEGEHSYTPHPTPHTSHPTPHSPLPTPLLYCWGALTLRRSRSADDGTGRAGSDRYCGLC